MKILRKIIEIDEALCNGCGKCAPSCAEGAIQIINGKARLVFVHDGYSEQGHGRSWCLYPA